MKKIVALVLCLALALSLATVAFAADSKTLKASDGYQILDSKNALVSKNDEGKALDLTETVTGNSSDPDGVITYTATTYKFDDQTYYKVAKDAGEYKLTKNGKYVCTLDKLDDGEKVPTTDVKLDKYVSVSKAGKECGEAVASYGVAGSTYYAVEGGTAWAIYKGEFVVIGDESEGGLADESLFVQHDFTDETYKTNTDGEKVSVICDTCNKSFKVVGTGCAEKKADISYTGSFAEVETNVYALLGTTASGSTGSDNVESAETFDAGIAVYAGMALASVAGSAVVIGKKKEF